MTTDPTQTEPSTESPKWFLDENTPGAGERPIWLNEKFKSASDMAKSYNELEKKFGQVPDQYDLSKSKFLNPDDNAIKDFLSTAKEKRVSKDVMDKLVDSIDKYVNQFEINQDEEAKKLGENAKERLTVLDNWAKANLSSKAYEALKERVNTADAILALEELRGKVMSNQTMVPGGNESAGSTAETTTDVRNEMITNYTKYKSDPEYRAAITKRLERASDLSSYIDKTGA